MATSNSTPICTTLTDVTSSAERQKATQAQPASAYRRCAVKSTPSAKRSYRNTIDQLPPYFFVGHSFGIAPDAGCFLPVALGRLLIHYGSVTLAVLFHS
jgi:hypothetical protein